MRLSEQNLRDLAVQEGWEVGYAEGRVDEMTAIAGKLRDYVKGHPESSEHFLDFIDTLENT